MQYIYKHYKNIAPDGTQKTPMLKIDYKNYVPEVSNTDTFREGVISV